MRTVKEVSELTGVSTRTLHYYDEIGLFPPTDKSEAGYRLYDDRALEILQQILFFREFGIPLKDIKTVMKNPSLDRNQILQLQREMLVEKKERMERLIASIDKMFQLMFDSMPEEMRQTAIGEFGSLEHWKKHYIEAVSSEDMQKRYAKVVEWYGGKDAYLSTLENPISREVAESYKKREDTIRKKLIEKRGSDLNSFEVKAIIGEYGFVMKQVCQMKEEEGLMLAVAQSYRNRQCQQAIDQEYGEGAAEFFAQAIEAFYCDGK